MAAGVFKSRTVLIAVRFLYQDPDRGVDYNDTLYYPPQSNATALNQTGQTVTQIAAAEKARFDAWRAARDTPPVVPPPPTHADLLAQREALTVQLANDQAALDAVNTALIVTP